MEEEGAASSDLGCSSSLSSCSDLSSHESPISVYPGTSLATRMFTPQPSIALDKAPLWLQVAQAPALHSFLLLSGFLP